LAQKGQGLARVCAAGIRGLSQMRPSGAWVHAGVLRHLSRWAPGGVQLQAQRVLPQLWGTTHGRKRDLGDG
jgi:hypothetical protein